MPFICMICGNPYVGYVCVYCTRRAALIRPLYSFLKKRRCAQCWGPVKDRLLDDGSWEIYCPKECEPGGHVSEEHVEMTKKQDEMDAAKVAFNYPELDPTEPIEGESEALFQEE